MRAVEDSAKRINHRVAGDEDGFSGYALRQQCLPIVISRREVVGRQPADEPPVHFFGERAERVAGPQARLDVRNRNLVGETAQGASHRRCRIALNKNHIWTRVLENRLQRCENPCADLVR